MQLRNISSKDAYEILENDNEAILVDVRTEAEWLTVGIPDLSALNKEVFFLSWIFYPDYSWNQNFYEEILAKVPNKGTKLIFLCKSGGRSSAAAEYLMNVGYINCYNIVGGFEDPTDGWKASGLKWR